ncbi:MAG TPA: YihY/virulence factor BrkB family protein [Negativicutes bacterium]|nr:YihY/virulence factor BrkB family protein [Negativicutes bacterium]
MYAKLRSSMAYRYIRRLMFRYKEAELAAMSAQITYYLILAFFPFLFFLINLLSFTPLSNRLLIANFSAILPSDTAVLVKNMLVQTVQAKSGTLMLLGMLGSLWASSRGMAAIIRGLNNSYGVKESRGFVRLVVSELAATAGLTVMIILSFFTIVFGRIIGSYVFGLLGGKALFYSIWAFVRYGISLALMFVTFFLIYKYLPNRKLMFRHIKVGAAFTTFGWVSASLLFSFYVNYFALYEKVYGSLGGLFALIIWLYISTLIFLLGGELNAISSNFEEERKK